MQKPEETLRTTINSKIASVEFGSAKGNSLSLELLNRLANEFKALSNNSDVVVIVIKSTGRGAFCAGASFDELLAISNETEASHFFSGFANLLNAMRECSKIIIGRIQGKAVGGGIGVVAACDYAMATNQSDIKLSELSIGIGPFVIEPALSRKMGKAAVTEMTLDTAWKSASWAIQKGLFAKVFLTIDQLDEEVSLFANKLASYNAEALLQLKNVLWAGTENWQTLLYDRAVISGKLVLSDFSKNALKEFRK